MKSLARTFLGLFIGMAVIGCCDDDCPTCAEPKSEQTPDFRMLLSGANPDFVWQTYTLSSETNTYIDTLVWPNQPPVYFEYTPDGRYLLFVDRLTHRTYCTDVESGDTVAYSDQIQSLLAMSPTGEFVAGGEQFAIVSVPDMLLVFQDSIDARAAAFSHAGSRVYASDYTHAGLAIYDLSGSNVSVEYRPSRDSLGNTAIIRELALTADDSKLLLGTGGAVGPWYFHVRDTDSFTILTEHNMPWPITFVALHPDGCRAFVGYYDLNEISLQGTVLEYDIADDRLNTFLDKNAVVNGVWLGTTLSPTEMVILPDGTRGYIVSAFDPFLKPSQPLIEVDLVLGSVLGLISLPEHASLERLVLNPRDWNDVGG